MPTGKSIEDKIDDAHSENITKIFENYAGRIDLSDAELEKEIILGLKNCKRVFDLFIKHKDVG